MFGYNTWDSVKPYVFGLTNGIKSGVSWVFSGRPEPEYTFDCLNKDSWKELLNSNSTQAAPALKKALDYCGEPGRKMVEKLTYTFDCLNPLAWKNLLDTDNVSGFTKAKEHCGEKGSEVLSTLSNEWSNSNYLQAGAAVIAVSYAAYRNKDKIYAVANKVSSFWENNDSKVSPKAM